MRKIKFKAWSIKDELMLDWSTMRQSAFNIGKDANLFYSLFNNPNYILMQYIGKEDKYGKEVYKRLQLYISL